VAGRKKLIAFLFLVAQQPVSATGMPI